MSEHMIESLGVSVEDLAEALLDTATPFDFADFCAPHSYYYEPDFNLSRSRVADLAAYLDSPEKEVRISATEAESEAVAVLAFSVVRVLEFRASYDPDADVESLPVLAKHGCPIKAFVVEEANTNEETSKAAQIISGVIEVLGDVVDEAFGFLDDELVDDLEGAARTQAVLQAFNIHIVPVSSADAKAIRGNSAFCVIDLSSNPEVREIAEDALVSTRSDADIAHIEAVGIYVTKHECEGLSAT